MSEQTNTPESNEQAPKEQLSEQQLAEMRKRMIKYYSEQVDVLKHQARYETLLADIEEARARRMQMTIRLAQMMAGPKESTKTEGPQAPETNSQQS